MNVAEAVADAVTDIDAAAVRLADADAVEVALAVDTPVAELELVADALAVREVVAVDELDQEPVREADDVFVQLTVLFADCEAVAVAVPL